MASEQRRGCGYRKVGGLYLVGGMVAIPCDRLPYELRSCKACGCGIHFTRGMTEIEPLNLFGIHEDCQDTIHPCYMCDPTNEPAFIMTVGEKFYPTPMEFMVEAQAQGISKRISRTPKNLILGKTVIYLAHNKAVTIYIDKDGNRVEIDQAPEPFQEGIQIEFGDTRESLDQKLAELGTKAFDFLETMTAEKKVLGIFSAFVPKAIEKLYWQSELDAMSQEEKDELESRNITPVGIPDGDTDHA